MKETCPKTILSIFSPPGLGGHKAARGKDPTPHLSLLQGSPPHPLQAPRRGLSNRGEVWGLHSGQACGFRSFSIPAPIKEKHWVRTPFSERGPHSRGGSSSRRAQATQVGGSRRGRAAAGPGKPREGCRAPRSNSRRHQLTSCSPPSSSLKAPANERLGKAGPAD